NWLAILLVVTTIVLAFVIWGLGQVLIVLSKQALEKQKQSKQSSATALTILFLFFTQFAFSQNTVTEAVKVAPNYGGLSATSFYMFLLVIMAEIFAVFALVFSIKKMYSELMPQKKNANEPSKLSAIWASFDKKFFTKAVPVEKEADFLLDHDYDGIKELDNALPPWWKYGFYITIVVGIIYLFNFHGFGNGKNPTQEYMAEMDKAKIEKEIFEANNKDKIDEANVPMANADGIGAGKKIYETKCVACHGAKGEGGAGPNLTDNFWLHKGSLNDIYNTIKVGYPDKGMQSWATEFTPKEMSLIASYVKTLHGTNPPNGKAPQGDLFTEDATANTTDTVTKAVTSKVDTGKSTK
ncbi:MAG: c-type cytochrome, partial [Ferruginibacter sp.]|nr:c-type cytochrome [Ferruginibacter sp.]